MRKILDVDLAFFHWFVLDYRFLVPISISIQIPNGNNNNNIYTAENSSGI